MLLKHLYKFSSKRRRDVVLGDYWHESQSLDLIKNFSFLSFFCCYFRTLILPAMDLRCFSKVKWTYSDGVISIIEITPTLIGVKLLPILLPEVDEKEIKNLAFSEKELGLEVYHYVPMVLIKLHDLKDTVIVSFKLV